MDGAGEHAAVAEQIQVRRWRRFGHDRLYVSVPDRGDVGFFDLALSEAHPKDPTHHQVIVDAAAGWRADQLAAGSAFPAVSPPAEPVSSPVPSPSCVPAEPSSPAADPEIPAPQDAEPAPRPWRDLATNPAGAAARQQAHAARDAAPVRTFLARTLRVHNDERAWRIGADGEEKVAAQLSRLAKQDSRWHVIHAIPVGTRGSDIDHLVIGPGGVFTVNTKHHPRADIWVGGNTFLVNGVQQPYVRNSRSEATRAARFLTVAAGFAVHVEGLVVPVNAGSLTVKSTAEGVHVVPRMQLARWLQTLGEVLSDDRVQALYAAARRSSTWSG